MSKNPPTLALDLSGDAATLQQLAFDGHWHEMARAGFNEVGLAEKMAFMRRVAVRLEGHRFRNVVWLPVDQIVSHKLRLAEGEADAMHAEASLALAALTSHPAEDFQIEFGEMDEDGLTPVAALRKTTMAEASRFATSHGFKAESFSISRAPDGFPDLVYFAAPKNMAAMVQQVGMAAGIVLAIGLTLAGAWWADPFGWRNADLNEVSIAESFSDEAPDLLEVVAAPDSVASPADVTPQDVASAVNPAPEPAFQDPLPDLATTAEVPPVADLTDPLTDEAAAIVAAAETALTDPVDQVVEDVAPAILLPEDAPTATVSSQEPQLAEATTPPEPAPDVEVASAEVDPALETPRRGFAELLAEAEAEPALPAAPAAQDEAASETPASEIDVATAPQTEPVAETAAVETPVAPEATATEAENIDFSVISGRPTFSVLLRSGDALPDRVAVPQNAVAEGADPQAAPEAEAADQPIDIVAAEDVPVVIGRPGFDALLRDPGALANTPDAVPELAAADSLTPALPADPDAGGPETPEDEAVEPEAAVVEVDPEAMRLRPARRPEGFAEEAVAAEDILSGSAPRVASRAPHRSADFAERIAPLVTARQSAPVESAPAVPAEPQAVSLPTRASVARAATIENAINLREIALIGIFGTADSRRALLRLASGRYIRLSLGETFSGGWRVVAMDENAIRVQKGSRTEILRISGG